MNIEYLLKYTAQQLHTIIRVYTKDQQFVSRIDYAISHKDFLDDKKELCQCLLDTQARISITSINKYILYATVHLPEQTLLIGPVKVSYALLFTNHWEIEELPEFEYYICDFMYYLQLLLLIYNLNHNEEYSQEQLYADICIPLPDQDVNQYYSDLVFSNREEGMHHNSYTQEQRMLACIENGNLKMLDNCRNEEVTEYLGKLSNDADRNARNLSIVAVTLVSRAAVRGGVNPELAYSLCDSYIIQIENMTELSYLYALVEGAKTAFTSMVWEIKQRKPDIPEEKTHPLIEQAKDYIFAHLHGKVTLKEVAQHLYVNQNYLSDLFKKYEGISFTDFVLTEKVNLVKNMLLYSPYSFNDISAYLGFSSQSHLGKVFKKITGMTLREYQGKYK